MEDSNPPKAANTFVPVSFSFSGKTGEYWQIWIVNVLLTIVTLGIYSAWAKVRNERYFYGNTELDGHRFSYLATPIQILKGRIIAVILFVSYYLLSSFSPVAGLVLMLILLFAFPFLICASLRFNLRMSSYRNVRFDFKGQYGEALLNFLVLPVASLFTFYLLLPWVLKRIDNFLISNSYYGDRQFKPELETGQYYFASFLTVIAMIFAVMTFGFALGLAGIAMPTPEAIEQGSVSSAILPYVILVIYFLVFTVVSAVYTTMIRNHMFRQTELDEVAKFDSSFSIGSLAWLNLSNLAIVIFSLGFALPWAKIRKARYVVGRTEVQLNENKENVIDNIAEQSNALGEEVANIFDVDVALT